MGIRARCRELIESKVRTPEPERLEALFDVDWEWTLDEYPELGTLVGEPGHDDRWTDQSLEAIERRKGDVAALVDAVRSFDRDALDDGGRLNLDLFARHSEEALETTRFKDEYLAISPMTGPQVQATQVLEAMQARTREKVDALLARLEGLPTVLDQTVDLLRAGIEAGITMPKAVMVGVDDQIRAHVTDDPEQGPEYGPFARIPSDVADADASREQARALIASEVTPAFGRLLSFVTDEYVPACRDSIGMSDLPDGEAWYAFRARHFTTTDLTPREIHQIGLDEVERIRAAMDEAMRAASFEGTFAEFTAFLRTDPRFYFERAEDLLAAYRDIGKRAYPELIKLFGTLPRLPYAVEPTPAYMEARAPAAYYLPGSAEAGRAGVFFANTYDLPSRPRWEMEALCLHEAVPGHHLQIALAQERDELPMFRRHGGFTAYIEGWGLYAESLGDEMGFYTDPHGKFGQLTFEIWRAIRLVVDTGMHALGWSRQQAIDFFESNTGKPLHDIVVEVDRYIAWPGQALAYKIGELKFKALRARATEALGDAFDVRAFHDECLRHGAVPLDVLERRIEEWIGAR